MSSYTLIFECFSFPNALEKSILITTAFYQVTNGRILGFWQIRQLIYLKSFNSTLYFVPTDSLHSWTGFSTQNSLCTNLYEQIY